MTATILRLEKKDSVVYFMDFMAATVSYFLGEKQKKWNVGNIWHVGGCIYGGMDLCREY